MKAGILLLAFICSTLAVFAQDTMYLSLDKLLQTVETNYPALIRYQYTIQALEAKTEGAKSWMPPTISAGAMRFPYNLSMIKEKDDPMNQAGITIAIEQMIPNPGKLRAKRDYFNSLAEIEKSKSNWTKNELRREAKILYFKRYIAEQKNRILQENEALLKLLLSTAEEKYSTNQTRLQTLYKARARLAEIDNMVQMVKGEIAESNIGISTLMVQDRKTVLRIDTLIYPRYSNIVTEDTGKVAKRNDIVALERYIQTMKMEQKLMQAGNRPDFGIRGEHAQMFGMPNQWSIMGMITIPVVPWSSNMYTSETKSIGFQVQSMEKEKQTMELMAQKMITEKRITLTYQYTQYLNYIDKIIPAYEQNLAVNLIVYNQNTGDFFVLLDAWEMLLMKKLESNDALFSVLKSEAEYEYELEIR